MIDSLVGVLQCPDPNEFCSQAQAEGCRDGCFANGKCVEGACQCKDGWKSDSCEEKRLVIYWDIFD